MSSWLIIVTGLIYAYIAVEQGIKGNTAMLVIYGGYSCLKSSDFIGWQRNDYFSMADVLYNHLCILEVIW
jgi:hypothetical protein